MQLVLSNNRVVAHGENFLAMGGVVINTVTGAKYENATIAECNGCPSDIDEVGYEYHAGVFVPCAPYGKGNNNGYFMEVCEDCATPRSSGISIKGGLKCENLGVLVWENASPNSRFDEQTIGINDLGGYAAFVITFTTAASVILSNYYTNAVEVTCLRGDTYSRAVQRTETGIYVSAARCSGSQMSADYFMQPQKIYGVKL